MSINWSEELKKAEEAVKPLSLGPHTFRVIEAKPATASTGSQMIKTTMKTEGGVDDGKVGYMNVVFSFDNPRAMAMTFRRLKSFGIAEEWLRSDNPSFEQIAARMIGRQVNGNVTHRDFNGQMQSDIDVVGASQGVLPDAPVVPIPQIPRGGQEIPTAGGPVIPPPSVPLTSNGSEVEQTPLPFAQNDQQGPSAPPASGNPF